MNSIYISIYIVVLVGESSKGITARHDCRAARLGVLSRAIGKLWRVPPRHPRAKDGRRSILEGTCTSDHARRAEALLLPKGEALRAECLSFQSLAACFLLPIGVIVDAKRTLIANYIVNEYCSAMSKLSIVGTPIGNLEDITLRALRTLKEADVIFCEDTRVTKKLLERYEINPPAGGLKRLDAHTEMSGADEILALLEDGKHVVYVTDAGTPGISDPGVRLVRAVRDTLGDEIIIESVPGPSALTAALSVAGIKPDTFVFLGFPPHKKGRQTLLKRIASTEDTVVLYESTHRIRKLLAELIEHIGEREVAVARELTKMHEEVRVGTAAELTSYFEEHVQAKGEFVVIIGPIST